MTNEVATPTNPMEDFKEKIIGRLREDIRDFFPDAALAELVKRAVDEEFFKTKKENDSYGRGMKETPSWFVQEVVKAATPILEQAVVVFVETNRVSIDKAIAEYLTPQNLTVVAVRTLAGEISAAIHSLPEAIKMATRYG